jgi:hypothetical protein
MTPNPTPTPGTPLPWAHDSGPALSGRYHTVVGNDDDEPMICELYEGSDENRAQDAAYIVWACNNAPALLSALEDCASGLEYVRHRYGELGGVGFDRALNTARTAITTATGGTNG